MMKRILLGALLALTAGCMDVGEKADLTPQQRKAWNEKRKEVADSPYIIVGYDADDHQWLTCVYTDPKLARYEWRQTVVDIWGKDDLETNVRVLAKDKAQSGRIAATAIVDLVGEDNPKVIAWYFMDGEKLKHSKGAPRPDLGVSLKQYLLYIQTNPAMVKRLDS